jgi:hypothetical protein
MAGRFGGIKKRFDFDAPSAKNVNSQILHSFHVPAMF